MTQGFGDHKINQGRTRTYHKFGEMEVNFNFLLTSAGSQNRHFMTRLPVPFSPNEASVLVPNDFLAAPIVPGLGCPSVRIAHLGIIPLAVLALDQATARITHLGCLGPGHG